MKLEPLVAAAVIGLLLLAPHAARADTDPRVATLIRESGAALHVASLRTIRTIRATGDIVADGLAGRADNWNEMGRWRAATRFSTPPLGGGSGWDGEESWTLDQTGLVLVDGSTLGRSTAIDQAYLGNYDLWTAGYGGARVVWSRSERVMGKSYDVLSVRPRKSRLPLDVWFDRTSHMPVKAVQTAGPLVTTTALADFRPVHGLMIPYRVVTSTNAGDSTSFTARTVTANPPDRAADLVAPSSSPHDFSIAGGATETSVPIQTAENHVYIEVMLNGKGPFHFILDTGAANIIDSGVAKALGLATEGSAPQTGVGSASSDSSFAIIKKLQVGEALIADQVFSVLPIAQSLGRAHDLPMEGAIGYEVLSRFETTFDYGNKKVIFRIPGSHRRAAGAAVIPIALYGTLPQFPCSIDGVQTTCTLDTGARQSISLFSPFIKAHPGVVPATLTAPGVNGFGVGGAANGRLGRLRTLSFGGLTLRDLIGDYSTQSKGGLAMPFIGANVGGGVWKRFTMTLDYGRLTMTLTPNANFNMHDAWDRSGVFLINEGAVTVVGVRPGTPAAKAALAKGDVIVSVNGSSDLTLRQVRALFLAAPGTVEHLVIRSKDGKTHNVDLTLADYV